MQSSLTSDKNAEVGGFKIFPDLPTGSIANMNIGSYVIEFMSKSILSP
jgi:hypothetical protein